MTITLSNGTERFLLFMFVSDWTPSDRVGHEVSKELRELIFPRALRVALRAPGEPERFLPETLARVPSAPVELSSVQSQCLVQVLEQAFESKRISAANGDWAWPLLDALKAVPAEK